MAKKKKKSSNKPFILLGVAFLAFIVLALVAKQMGWIGNDDGGREVEVAAAEVRTITQEVTASGRIQPEIEVRISPDVSGEITSLGVNEGDTVTQGQELLRIKPDFYVTQVEQASARVSQARASVTQAKANLAKAKLDLDRTKGLFEKQVVPESEFQAAQTQFDVAQANEESARFAVESAAASEREFRVQLSKTRILAPMSGTVSQLNVEVGDRVVGTTQMAGTEIMTIAKLDRMELEVDVNENDVINVAIGDSAAIEIDAFPEQRFFGLVTEIANSARVSGLGTQEQVTNFPVKIRIVDRGSAGEAGNEAIAISEVPTTQTLPIFRPGMSGTVDVFTNTVSDVIAIPIQAVTVRDMVKARKKGGSDDEEGEEDAAPSDEEAMEEDLRKVVFVVDGGKASMVEVETGIRDDRFIEVRSGVNEDAEIVIGPYSAVSRMISDGDKLKVKGDDRSESQEENQES